MESNGARVTASGDYRLPGKIGQRIKSQLVRVLALMPAAIRQWYIGRHNFYQAASAESMVTQGSPANKFDAIGIPQDLTGYSVLDIGCAEGYFARECASRSADQALGVDANFASVLCAALLARENRLDATFKVGSFPDPDLHEEFDIVFCLSVLHHMVSTKDIWLVLSDSAFAQDLNILRGLLEYLWRRTAPGGLCVIEMPYEPGSQKSSESVDYDALSDEIRMAGFRSVERIGSWEFENACKGKKERQIYNARR